MLTPDEIKIFSLCAPHLPGSPVVFDVGAYKGGYTEMVLTHFKYALTYLFEPNAQLYNALKENFAPERVFNIAVSHAKGRIPFYRCVGKADELSSTYQREIFGEVGYIEEDKPCTSIDIFCNEKEIMFIDFLKIDAEGAEFDILKGSQEMLKAKCIRFVQIEYGGTYKDANITFKQIMEFVNQFGYKVYEIVDSKFFLIVDMIEDYRFTNFLITRHDFK